MDWLIEKWFPRGHRGQVTAPEGVFKTILKCCKSVCIASGFPFLGCKVQQGPVLIVDEETPEDSLHNHLQRFAVGLGIKDWRELPITTLSMTGFRFDRKVELDKLANAIAKLQPVFITLDSLIAMLPGGRQRVVENDSHIGEIIRDEVNSMLQASSSPAILLAAHSKKPVADFTIEELRKSDMQSLVRGHGSIVGEGCDTGFVLKKLSEYPKPTRFAIITKARRQAIPMSGRVVFVEMKEEEYGKGWARLEEIPPESIPPSPYARQLYLLFVDGDFHCAGDIKKNLALFSRKDILLGIHELSERSVILDGSKPQTYRLNPRLKKECASQYIAALKAKE